MNKWKQILKFAEKRMPEMLVASGIMFEYAAIIDAVRHTPQAERLIAEQEDILGRPLTKMEIVKTCWKCYIPTAIESTVGTACIIGGAVKYRKQNAALMALYSMSEGALSEYKKKTIEVVGDEKVKEIEQKLDQEAVSKLALPGDNDEESPNADLSLSRRDICLDTWINKKFYASEIEIREAVNELNDEINHGDFVSLNDFYFKIGQDPVDFGGEIGWDSDIGLIDLRISSCVKDGRAILTMSFKNTPKSTPYSRFY